MAWKFTEWDNVSVDVADKFTKAAALGNDDTTVIDIICKVEELVVASANRSEAEIMTELEAIRDWRPDFKDRALAHARAVGWVVAISSPPPPPPPPPPVLAVTSITPTEGEETGGLEVEVTGSGFTADCQVFFFTPATKVVGTDIRFVSDTKILAKTPAFPVGVASVEVKNNGGESVFLADAFTFKTKVAAPPPSPPPRSSTPPAGSASRVAAPVIAIPPGVDPKIVGDLMIRNGEMVGKAVKEVVDQLTPHMAKPPPPPEPPAPAVPPAPMKPWVVPAVIGSVVLAILLAAALIAGRLTMVANSIEEGLAPPAPINGIVAAPGHR
jgi:hypothetical protein